MIFHWLTDDGRNNGTGYVKFGTNFSPVQDPLGIKPDYVTIGKHEFEAAYKSEKLMLRYMSKIKATLSKGGKIYIETVL